MKKILVKKREINHKEFIKRPAVESDFSTLVREDAVLVDENGKKVLLYFKFKESTDELRNTVKSIKYNKSTRSGGLVTNSKIFGFDPATGIRKPYCSATALAIHEPHKHDVIVGFGTKINEIYREYLPEAYAEHNQMADDKINPDWRIPGTPFTSGIVNQNNQLNYHFDSGNFDGVYSNMIVLKNNTAGGYLSLPEYDIGLECGDNTLVMFDGQNILHGVTPIRLFGKSAHRYSLVYYTLKAIWNCDELTEEVLKVRNRRVKIEERNATL